MRIVQRIGPRSWRVVRDDERDALVAERDRLRAACRHVVENCYCQPSGQHCDVCLPAALALITGQLPSGDGEPPAG